MPATEEPSEPDIGMLCDVTGLLRPEAIKRLKSNNNDLQRAIEEYFEDPTGEKYKWDDSHFSSSREGDANNPGISFNIQAPDELPPLGYQNSAAPTRPPSRTTTPLGAPTNTDQEDDDLQRALAESAAASGIQPQEAGVVDSETNQKYFGPANRLQYQVEDWSMVPTKASVDTAKIGPAPSKRKRDPETPAFLRQTKDHRVGAILSIFHKIPLVRNILLRCGRPARNYGHNSEWWNGQKILKQETLAAMATGEDIWGDDAHPDFSEELHRLLAFLDKTERSYGSVDSFIETKPMDPTHGAWVPDVEDNLAEALKQASQENPDCDINPMVTIGQQLRVPPAGGEHLSSEVVDSGDGEMEQGFIFLDVRLGQDRYECVGTLYDALDQFLWQEPMSPSYEFVGDKFAALKKPADVLTFRLGGSGLVRPCEVPAIFYADRYMRDRKDSTIHFMRQIREIRTQLQNLETWERERFQCKGEHGCSRLKGLGEWHDIRACRERTIELATNLLEQQKKDAQWRYFERQWRNDTPYSMEDLRLLHTSTGPFELTSEEEANRRKWEFIIKTSRREMEDIDRELADCKDKKEELTGCLQVIRKRLTCQEHEADDDLFVFRSNPDAYQPEYWNPTRKFMLRGIALTRDLAYVCVRHEPDLVDIDGQAKPMDQWWKIGYAADEASPIKTEKVTLDDTVQAAGTESKNPILIYATEAAMEARPTELSDPLRMFVKADNRSFQQEIAQEQSQGQDRVQDQHQMQDLPPAALGAEGSSQIPFNPGAKRKLSNASSIATHGSLRSDLAEVDLTFPDDPVQFDDDSTATTHHQEFASNMPMTHHQEFANNTTQLVKLGGIVESLASCRTRDNDSPILGRREVQRDYGVQQGGQGDNYESMEELRTFDSSATDSKGPEMQERSGGMAPFLTRPGSKHGTQPGPIDMMDLDDDEEQRRGG
ncbi:Uu.00g088200.m01.CDS01 [Anthostomella pinea]|uniref:Uu.00g088200.m01.CDS01 n=1 Tax=Anthostomella pinea TaxID=933095 RepID=A0AAI8YHN4_9PEZI|nr:Uu.00g088200.m01.CDS01 [Anthostomella pinea]